MIQSNTKPVATNYQLANGLNNGLDHPKPVFQSTSNKGNSYDYGQMSNMQGQGFEISSGVSSNLADFGSYGQLKNLTNNCGALNKNSTHMQQIQLQQPQAQTQQARQQFQTQQQLQQQLQQMQQQQQQQQQMPFNNGYQLGSRSYFPTGSYQGSMYPYSQMSYPMYPPMPAFSPGMAGNPFVSPTNIPVDGYVSDFGGDFKVLGYDTVGNSSNSQTPTMNFQNSSSGTNSSLNRGSMNVERKFPMF